MSEPTGPHHYFSFDGETYTTHPTEEAARKEASDAIEFFRAEAGFDGEWQDEVARVCWGEIREHAEAVPDEQSEDDEPRCDYALTVLEAQPKGVRDVLAEYAALELREEGTRDSQIPALVGNLLATPVVAAEGHPRSRLVLCAALLLAEIDRLDRANPQPTPTE